MRQLFILIILHGITWHGSAQEVRSKAIEKRAREFHRVIGLEDKALWKKFITENYSQALIDKAMKSVVNINSQSTTTTAENIDEKTGMFQRLHQDFGDSKIVSLKPVDDNLEMILESSKGLKGTFNLKFNTKDPYLIDGIGIDVSR
jgi:hypothetical protein